MINIFIILFQFSFAQETDCNAVQQFIYPRAKECAEKRTCSRGYACYVEEDNCDAYACKKSDACPVGTTYLPFVPPNPTRDTGDGTGYPAGSTTESGYGCFPEDKIPEETFECFFDGDDSNKLKVNVQVPEIMKMDAHSKIDFREITLISKEKYDSRDTGKGYVDIFESQHATENGKCVGVKGEDGKVIFQDVTNSEKCQFTIDYEMDASDALWYTQRFVVGYDDLFESQPNGIVGIKRYGQNWIMNCRIKASDVQYVYPGGEGKRDELEIDYFTNVNFDLKMYRENDFKSEFNDGETINLDPDSKEPPVIFLKASAQVPNEDTNWMVHIKSCEVETIDTLADNTIVDLIPYDFITDGCRTDDQGFISTTFELQPQRTEWTDTNLASRNFDQFSADLWQNAKKSMTYNFKCELVVCDIAAFQRGDFEDYSICSLNQRTEECANRYNNLFGNARQSRKTEYRKSAVVTEKRSLTFDCDGICERNDQSGTSSLLFSFSLMTILLYLL